MKCKLLDEIKMLMEVIYLLSGFSDYESKVSEFKSRVSYLVDKNNEGVKPVRYKDENGILSLEGYSEQWNYGNEDYDSPEYDYYNNAENNFVRFCNNNNLWVINKSKLDTAVREKLFICRLNYEPETNELSYGNY